MWSASEKFRFTRLGPGGMVARLNNLNTVGVSMSRLRYTRPSPAPGSATAGQATENGQPRRTVLSLITEAYTPRLTGLFPGGSADRSSVILVSWIRSGDRGEADRPVRVLCPVEYGVVVVEQRQAED